MIDSRAYTEVYNIINCLSVSNKEKIPEDVRKNIENNMDKEYVFDVNINNIGSMPLLEDTQKILATLYTDYFASEEEREAIKAKEIAISIAKEKELESNQTNQYEIKFDKNDDNVLKEEAECKDLVEYKTNYFKRMLDKIKKIFKK
jgi:hypothetical protein